MNANAFCSHRSQSIHVAARCSSFNRNWINHVDCTRLFCPEMKIITFQLRCCSLVETGREVNRAIITQITHWPVPGSNRSCGIYVNWKIMRNCRTEIAEIIIEKRSFGKHKQCHLDVDNSICGLVFAAEHQQKKIIHFGNVVQFCLVITRTRYHCTQLKCSVHPSSCVNRVFIWSRTISASLCVCEREGESAFACSCDDGFLFKNMSLRWFSFFFSIFLSIRFSRLSMVVLCVMRMLSGPFQFSSTLVLRSQRTLFRIFFHLSELHPLQRFREWEARICCSNLFCYTQMCRPADERRPKHTRSLAHALSCSFSLHLCWPLVSHFFYILRTLSVCALGTAECVGMVQVNAECGELWRTQQHQRNWLKEENKNCVLREREKESSGSRSTSVSPSSVEFRSLDFILQLSVRLCVRKKPKFHRSVPQRIFSFSVRKKIK